MNPEKHDIAPSQYIILVVGFLQGSVLVLSFMDSIAKQDAWLVLILALALSIPFVLSYAFLAKWYPGKNLIEINDLVFGKYVGKLISALYIVYFFMLFTFNLRDLADFYTGYIMQETPKIVFMVVFVLTCAYAVKKGIRVIAKTSLFPVLFTFISIVTTSILLLGDMDFSNFLPILEISPITLFKATSHFMIVPYCELAVFLMVIPAVSNTKKIGRNTILGLGIAALSLLIVTIRNTAALGISSSAIDMASYQSVRLIDIAEFFTRIELMVALGFTMSLFIKVVVLYYATVKSVAQFFDLHDHAPLILPIGGIVIILASITYASTVSHFEFALKYNVHLIALFEFILPPLALLIAKIRRTARQALVKYAGGKAS